MVTIEPISPQRVDVYKAVRLQGLQDSPLAFGSTYAKESEFSDAAWKRRAAELNGVRSTGYLAMQGEFGCGLALGFLDEKDEKLAHLVSMWVAPLYRQRGVGRLLVERVIEWAGGRGVSDLVLMVTSTNDSAIRFYRRLGFAQTGWTEPYPNDATLFEYEMSRPLCR